MTREEIIERLRTMKAAWMMAADTTPESRGTAAWAAEAIDCAISALKGPTRERLENVWRGGWKCQSDCGVTECTACKWNIEEYCGDYNFCPHCGAPMNDEAIQMVMERINELRGE